MLHPYFGQTHPHQQIYYNIYERKIDEKNLDKLLGYLFTLIK